MSVCPTCNQPLPKPDPLAGLYGGVMKVKPREYHAIIRRGQDVIWSDGPFRTHDDAHAVLYATVSYWAEGKPPVGVAVGGGA